MMGYNPRTVLRGYGRPLVALVDPRNGHHHIMKSRDWRPRENGRMHKAHVLFAWRAGQASALGGAEIANGKDVGTVEVTAKDGAPMAHDVTFASALNAFVKNAAVLTNNGTVNPASGAIGSRCPLTAWPLPRT
jgi:hypothetical protein